MSEILEQRLNKYFSNDKSMSKKIMVTYLKQIIQCIKESQLEDKRKSLVTIWIIQLCEMDIIDDNDLKRFYDLIQSAPECVGVIASTIQTAMVTYYKNAGSKEHAEFKHEIKEFIKLA